jgi:ferric-dicitrate binding protein FerR (iron transport regulator)
MKSPINENRWSNWFADYSDGTIDTESFSALQAALRDDPRCRAAWIRFCDLEAGLVCHFAEQFGAAGTIVPFPSPARRRSFPLKSLLAAAAITLAFVGFQFVKSRPGETEIRILEVHDVILPNGIAKWEPGQSVATRNLEILSGRVAFSTRHGVSVIASGPVSLEIHDSMRIEVRSGKVTAEAIPGFTIDTGNARLVDLGTQFGVEVGPDSQTHLLVFDGEVEVHNPGSRSAAPLATVRKGHAVSIAGSGLLKPVANVVTGNSIDDWSVSSGYLDGTIISTVSDNVTEHASQRFYPVFPKGLEEGVRAFPYQDKTPRWWGAVRGEFPTFLRGADFVQTLQQELHNPNLEITLKLERPCDLFIFQESEAPPPDWLARDFTLTGTRLVLSPEPPPAILPGDRSRQPLRIYDIWTKRVHQPGYQTFGPVIREYPGSPPHYMYGIAAKAFEPAAD